MTGKPLLRVSPDVISQQVGDGLVLLNLRTGVYWGLNRTGAVVWQALQQQCSFAGICREIESKFEASKEDVAATVRALMEELAGENLLLPPAPGETVASGAPDGAGGKMAGRPKK